MSENTVALFVLGPLDGERRVVPPGTMTYAAHERPPMMPFVRTSADIPDTAFEVRRTEYKPQPWAGLDDEGRLQRVRVWAPVGTSAAEIMIALIDGYGGAP